MNATTTNFHLYRHESFHPFDRCRYCGTTKGKRFYAVDDDNVVHVHESCESCCNLKMGAVVNGECRVRDRGTTTW